MYRTRFTRAALTAALVGVLALSACTGGSKAQHRKSTATAAPLPASVAGISAARCAQNKAAGKITFLTPYNYVASVGILDVLAAQQQGYFKAMCLDIVVKPGSVQPGLISSDAAQIGGAGSPSDAISAVANGAKIVGIATYANTSAIELMTMANSGIHSLKDFEGKTLGYHGSMPPLLQAMFVKAGVPTSKIKEVSLSSYDPDVLPKGQVQALVGYKSSEQLTLQKAGDKITVWDPEKYGLKSAFNVQIANAGFAKAHPTAVQDFLRASYAGFAYTDAHVATVVAYAEQLSGGSKNYPPAANIVRWEAESGLVHSTLLAGHGIGWQTTAQWAPELGYLRQFKLIAKPVDLTPLVDNSFNAAIYAGAVLKPVSAG